MSHCLWDPVAVDVVEFAGHCWSRMLSVCVVFWDFPVTLVFGPQWLRSLIVMLMFSSSILVLLSSSSITSDNKEEVWWLDVSWDVASALLCKTNSICFRVSYFGGTEALIRSLFSHGLPTLPDLDENNFPSYERNIRDREVSILVGIRICHDRISKSYQSEELGNLILDSVCW